MTEHFLFFFPKSCLHLNVFKYSPFFVIFHQNTYYQYLWENRSPFSIAGNKIWNPLPTQQPGWACNICQITPVTCLKPSWLFIDLRLKAKLLIIFYKCLHDLAPSTLSLHFSPAHWLPATLAFSVSWTIQIHFCWEPLTWPFSLPGCLDMLALHMAQVTAQMSFSEKSLPTTLLNVACFSLIQSLSHHLVCLPEIICLFLHSFTIQKMNSMGGGTSSL